MVVETFSTGFMFTLLNEKLRQKVYLILNHQRLSQNGRL